MPKLGVRSSLISALVVFAMVILASGWFSLTALRAEHQSATAMHRVDVQTIGLNDAYKDVQRARAALSRAYVGVKEYGSTEIREAAILSAEKSLARARQEMLTFEKGAALDPEIEALRKGILESRDAHVGAVERSLKALKAGDVAAYAEINEKEVATAVAFPRNIEQFQEVAQKYSEREAAQGALRYQWMLWAMAAMALITLVLVAAVHWVLKHTIVGPLSEAVSVLGRVAEGDLSAGATFRGSGEIGQLFQALVRMHGSLSETVRQVRFSSSIVHVSAHEIAQRNIDLSSRTENQASALEETAAAMEQFGTTVHQNAEHAKAASELAAKASATATKGGAVVSQVIETMKGIAQSSERITEIIAVIDSLAFQTNILALNAAVEAAHAGERGRGFAVVAGEIRTLAGRCAEAAKEIKSLISDGAERVALGSRLVGEAGSTMRDVVTSIRQVSHVVGEISASSQEQSSGVAQVGEAVTQIDHATQQNATLVEQMATSAAELQSQSDALIQTVSLFTLDDEAIAPHPLGAKLLERAAVD